MKKITFIIILVFQFSFSQNYTEYHTGNVTDLVVTPNSGVCLMGGASESDEAMVWFLNKANGGDVVVLRASGGDGYNNYFYSGLGIAINSVRTFVINNEAGAIDPYVLDKIENAEAIWFAGGDQYNYVNYFKDNAVETALNNFINVKQGVIGGTSAGMAILGSAYFSAENGTVTNAQALGNPYHNRMILGYNDFLEVPFLENVITDTHYDDPDRRARHAVFLARFSKDNNARSFGIACNEYTAVCIENDGKAYVYGDYPNYEEHAFFLQTNCAITDYIPENCTSGNALHWNKSGEALKVYKVPGMTTGENYFDLSDWTTGSGGNWENWFVNNGSFNTASTVNPNCSALSVSEFEFESIKLFPNPFQDKITIAKNETLLKIECFDAFGRTIPLDFNGKTIDTNELASGVYFFKVYTETSSKLLKMIKE
ncbi:cyanophycinase [Lacinutrix sp. Bg11-31]|nr:cyanophycinase [Lacinutrix sp. Bg11-31]